MSKHYNSTNKKILGRVPSKAKARFKDESHRRSRASERAMLDRVLKDSTAVDDLNLSEENSPNARYLIY